MTNRLELNWKVDGFVDEQRYYCSETPIDSENLPVPKVILDGEARSYIDTDVEVGKTYYVRVGSVKNGVEKISEEQSVYASNIDLNYKVKLLTSNNSLIDNGYSQLGWIESGSIVFSDNTLDFGQSAKLVSEQVYVFNGAWEFNFEFYIPASNTSEYIELVTNISTVWTDGGFQIAVGSATAADSALRNKLFIGSYGVGGVIASTTIARDTWYKVRITRTSVTSGWVYTIYLNDAQVASETALRTPDNKAISIGSSLCKIRNFTSK